MKHAHGMCFTPGLPWFQAGGLQALLLGCARASPPNGNMYDVHFSRVGCQHVKGRGGGGGGPVDLLHELLLHVIVLP